MFLAEALPPAGAPIVTLALMGLFTLATIFVLIGIIKSLDAIVRGFFGTVNGAVSWIPYANKVVQHANHKVEQKISHALGSAERKLDGYAAWTWHNMAHLVTWTASEIADGAKVSWHLAQRAKAYVHRREVTHEVRGATAPLKAQQSTLRRDQHNLASETKALHHSVAQGVYPRIKSAEWEIDHVLEPGLANVRARTKALEHGAVRTFDWIRAHKFSVATSAFVGAVAFAMTRLGVGWIRCANWKRVGRTVCGLPHSRIDALLALLVGALALANIRTLARFAEAVEHDAARGVADLVGVATRSSGQFTIE